MCGITGFWGRPASEDELRHSVRAMSDRLANRGPDGSGHWVDGAAGLAFGHRRLSIIDLSDAGSQPMESASGRWVITYNGEVYNSRALAPELSSRSVRFRGHSDTEVLLEAIDAWGIEAALPRLNGMFAFAAWDRESRELHLVRDRVGIKPLYYASLDGILLFGSEIKPLRAHPSFDAGIDRSALTALLRHSYVPAPLSIYEGVRKLPAGHRLVLRAPGDPGELHCWWDAASVAAQARRHPLEASGEELVDAVEATVRDAVAARMVADVPLGAFLSGGIDSSSVVSLMQEISDRPIRTFSIGFEEDAFNEAHYARRIAEHLGTDHTELYLSVEAGRELIPELPVYWDEPFADASQLPTLLVSRLARKSVTVSLSGDGGDELFCGYARYRDTLDSWRKFSRLPRPLRSVAAATLRGVLGARLDTLASLAGPLLPARQREAFGHTLEYRAESLAQKSVRELYRFGMSYWKRPDRVVLGAREPATALVDPDLAAAFPGIEEWMMIVDSLTYLPEDILTKVDRASMAVGLEARVPLLDHRVFELAWRLPLAGRVRDGETKWPLRRLLARRVPPDLFERPKQGFGVPIGDWLRGPLRSWAEDLLAPARLKREGHLDAAAVHRTWDACKRGHGGEYPIWIVLMFQSWLDGDS